jgi:hypothetical protein
MLQYDYTLISHVTLHIVCNIPCNREIGGRKKGVDFFSDKIRKVQIWCTRIISFNFSYFVGLNIRSVSDMYMCILTYFQLSTTVTASLCAYPILHIYIAAMLVLLIKINSKAPIWVVLMWLLIQMEFLEKCLINLCLTFVIEPGLRLTDRISLEDRVPTAPSGLCSCNRLALRR